MKYWKLWFKGKLKEYLPKDPAILVLSVNHMTKMN